MTSAPRHSPQSAQEDVPRLLKPPLWTSPRITRCSPPRGSRRRSSAPDLMEVESQVRNQRVRARLPRGVLVGRLGGPEHPTYGVGFKDCRTAPKYPSCPHRQRTSSTRSTTDCCRAASSATPRDANPNDKKSSCLPNTRTPTRLPRTSRVVENGFRLTFNSRPKPFFKVVELPHKEPHKEQYVYDLTTDNHHFHVGPGKLVVHNTDSCFVSSAESSAWREAVLIDRAHKIGTIMANDITRQFLPRAHGVRVLLQTPIVLLKKRGTLATCASRERIPRST